MNWYQDNKSREFFIYDDSPLNSNGEFVLYAASLRGEDKKEVSQVSLSKGQYCFVGTGLHIILGNNYPVFHAPHHIAIDRWFVVEATNELMLQVANPGSKIVIEVGDEIASFVTVKNSLRELNKVNSMSDL